MKGKFSLENQLQLKRLENTLANHEPYIVMSISATGVNDANFSEHYPTRVTAQEYVYSDEIKNYVKGTRTFDEMVKCSGDSLQHALVSSYDVFKSSGIDKEAYIRGDNVLPVEEFQQQFGIFMAGTKENTKIITNNAEFCIDILDSVNCGDILREAQNNNTLLDQPTLTAEYFDIHKINASSRLENLNNILRGKSATDDAAKIIGLENRNAIIQRFIERYGAEKGLLANERDTIYYEQANSVTKELTERGRANYRNATFEQKISTLFKTGIISEDVLNRESDCHFNRLLDVYENKNGIKGVTIIQSASSGFKAGDMPIQFSAIVVDVENGSIKGIKNQLSMDIAIDKGSLSAAVSQARTNQFDAFAYTGINQQAYIEGKSTDTNGNILSGVPVKTQDEALGILHSFFQSVDLREYPIISNGAARNDPAHSWSQNNLTKLGNLPAFEAPFIDISQVIKEYSYIAYTDEKYPKNTLIDIDNWNEDKTFAFQEVAEANGITDINHTLKKVLTIAGMAESIFQQQTEIKLEQEKPKVIAAEQKNIHEHNSNEPLQPPVDNDHSNRSDSYSGEDIGGVYLTQSEALAADGYTEISQAVATVSPTTPKVQPLSETELEDISEEQRQTAQQEADIEFATSMVDEGYAEKQPKSDIEQSDQKPAAPQSSDIAIIVAAMNAQTEAIKEQNSVLKDQITALRKQNHVLITAFSKQNEIISNTLDILVDKKNENSLDSLTISQRIETVKEQLAAITDEVNDKVARQSFSSANELIAKGQKSLSREQDKTQEAHKKT